MSGLPRAAAHRIVCAVVAAEMRRTREADPPRSPDGDWPEATPIGEEGLGLDSLEQLGALGALAETFGLDDRHLAPGTPRLIGDWTDWVLAGHAGGNGRFVVRTSGSTGHPRACPHAMADLIGEAAFLAQRFGDRRRVVALVPAHHLYGIIWTALLPGLLGIPVVVRPIGTPLVLTPGDLVVAVPDQWQAMLRMTRQFPDDVIGISSAGPLDDVVACRLLDVGLARLIDVYGSSETGAIALRTLPAADYALLPRWRLAPDGPDDWRLVDGGGVPADLPDHIERTGERSLRPAGRRDGAIQVAGHNVWPDRIAAILRGVEGVAEAAVRLHVNGRLKAFIVPDAPADADADADAATDAGRLLPAIERTVAAKLADHERPKIFRFGAAIPRNIMGKAEDWS